MKRKEEIIDLLSRQKKYFEKKNTVNLDFRISQLIKLKNVIKKNEKFILDALYLDLRKSEYESYTTEIGFLYYSLTHIIKNLPRWSKSKKVKTPLLNFGAKSYIYSEPYGSVLIIGAYNYPFQLVLEPLIGAIAAGNCAVLKPSEFTPNVSFVIKRIIEDNFDPEFISVVEGGKDVTSFLINSPFDYIFFTGSTVVGKIIMEAAGNNLVPITLELGGKSPCIVDYSTNIDYTSQKIVWGKFLNAGQTCVAPDYVLVHNKIKESLINKMKEKIKLFFGIKPEDSKDYARIINERHMNRLIELVDKSKIIVGGEYDTENLYFSPTLMDNVNWDDKIMEEEIFGPILPIIGYEDLDLVIKEINKRPKPLALYLFTENKKVETKILENISFGGGCINDTITHLTNPNLPFGGTGFSGIGSYHGEHSFNTFSHKKSILKRRFKINLPFIYPPYSDLKLKIIKWFMK